MSKALAIFVLVPLLFASLLSVLAVGVSLWDASCPFRNPLSELVLRVPSMVLAITRLFRTYKRTWGKRTSSSQSAENEQKTPMATQSAVGSEKVTCMKGDNGAKNGLRVTDEEMGQAGSNNGTVGGTQATAQLPSEKEGWAWLMEKFFPREQQAMTKSKSGFWARLRKGTEETRFLQVRAIKRVIDISQESVALYHAALNLRSITDLKLLKVVYDDERTTRVLRERYLEALAELKKKDSRASSTQSPQVLRETLAFGTAFFHVSLSAPSFDDFIWMIGTKDVTLPLNLSEMSPEVEIVAGNSCRTAQTFVRKFIKLQKRQLGPQPIALTSTTLAATAFWHATSGISHSQDIVYGDRFREALASSEVSWAGLGLLTFVSNITCKFDDASQSKPYKIDDIKWCRDAFKLVRDFYSL